MTTARSPGLAAELDALSRRQLFFVGGAPRSGTTWLQQILDAHPDVCCRGEGLLQTQLAHPLAALMDQRGRALEAKNTRLFNHTGGYPAPTSEDVAFLTATAILLAMRRQYEGAAPLAVGEKTPENVFFFPALRQMFPGAKFIAIARDPRDVLTSAWRFFHKPEAGAAEDEASKTAFVRAAIPSIAQGARAMIALADDHPDAVAMVTYEGLSWEPAPLAAALFRFLGVSDDAAVVARCLARTSFAAQTGRAAGVVAEGAFHRKGVVGDWADTLGPDLNALVLTELGFLFPRFGWRP
jgi:hypothetical protein